MKKMWVLLFLLTSLSTAHAGAHSGFESSPLPYKTITRPADVAKAIQMIKAEIAEGKLVLSLRSEKAVDVNSAVAAGFKVVAIELYAETTNSSQYVFLKYDNASLSAPGYIVSTSSQFYGNKALIDLK